MRDEMEKVKDAQRLGEISAQAVHGSREEYHEDVVDRTTLRITFCLWRDLLCFAGRCVMELLAFNSAQGVGVPLMMQPNSVFSEA